MSDTTNPLRTVNYTLNQTVMFLLNILNESGLNHLAGGGNSDGCTYSTREDGYNTFSFFKSVCIVGRLIDRLGFLGVLSNHDNIISGTCAVIWEPLERAGVYFDEDAQKFLREAQRQQDSGETWGQAVYTALMNLKAINRDAYDDLMGYYGHTIRSTFDGFKVTPTF